MDKKYYLAILAIIKDETAYIEEWLDYHISMGVEHFYIYDNESEDNLTEVLKLYFDKGFITYTYWPGKAQQIPAYNHALEAYKHEPRWLAIIDIDEFICPTEKINIPQFLKNYENCTGLTINWITFDSNGHINKQDGSILENYTRIHKNYQQEEINFAVKSIVNPLAIQKLYIHNHHYINDEHGVDENFNPVSSYWNTRMPVEKIRINHYRTKSKEEFLAKTARGVVSRLNFKRVIKETDYNFPSTSHDYTIWQHLKNKKSTYYRIKHKQLEFYKIIEQSQHFDSTWYMLQNDSITTKQSAIKHYLDEGWREGKNPSQTFNGNMYLEKNHDVKKAGLNPLLHYELHGKKEGRTIYTCEKE